jgi:glutathione S-transferase
MKLFYSPGACSLAPHIALRELQLEFELEKVDLANKKTESGRSYLEINPKGYVPTLEYEPGKYLTEGVAIQQYLASLKPQSGWLPASQSVDYYRSVEWLAFVSTELHKGLGPLFAGPNPAVVEKLQSRFKFLDQHLSAQDFLGPQFGAPDAYLFTVLSWTEHLKVDLSAYPALNRFRQRVGARAQVQKALEAEGLLAAK